MEFAEAHPILPLKEPDAYGRAPWHQGIQETFWVVRWEFDNIKAML
jgi:hypothetical protein